VYWFRLDLKVAACFRMADKPADAVGFTSCFLAEAQRTQKNLQVFVGATLVANIDNSRLKSLLQIIETSAFSAPLREQMSIAFIYIANLGCTDKKILIRVWVI